MADRAVREMEGFGSAGEAPHTCGGLERAQGLHRRKTIGHFIVPRCENNSHYVAKQIVCPEIPSSPRLRISNALPRIENNVQMQLAFGKIFINLDRGEKLAA
jgi:hypothetical protein